MEPKCVSRSSTNSVMSSECIPLIHVSIWEVVLTQQSQNINATPPTLFTVSVCTFDQLRFWSYLLLLKEPFHLLLWAGQWTIVLSISSNYEHGGFQFFFLSWYNMLSCSSQIGIYFGGVIGYIWWCLGLWIAYRAIHWLFWGLNQGWQYEDQVLYPLCYLSVPRLGNENNYSIYYCIVVPCNMELPS